MTDVRVLHLLKTLGVHHDAFGGEVCEKLYKIGIAFAKMVEEETMIRSKAKWYLLGAEDEREACAKICQEFLSMDCADAIRARGK